MYWDSFRFVARDLSVRYMMALPGAAPNLYLGGSLNCDLTGGKPSKPAHSLTHFHVLYNINYLLSWLYGDTQRTQNPPTFGSWGFDSPSRHHTTRVNQIEAPHELLSFIASVVILDLES